MRSACQHDSDQVDRGEKPKISIIVGGEWSGSAARENGPERNGILYDSPRRDDAGELRDQDKGAVPVRVFPEHLHVLIRRRGIPGLGGWFTTKSISGGGPLIDLGVHCLDAAMFVSGHWKPTAVSAATYSKFGNPIKNYKYINMWAEPPRIDGICDTEDYAAGFVRFGPDTSMNFEFAWAANTDDESFIEILGTKGGMRIFASKNPRLLTEFNGNIADVELLVPEQKDAFQIQARKFIRACRGECPSETTGDQGLITMKLIDAIYRSAASGKEELVC